MGEAKLLARVFGQVLREKRRACHLSQERLALEAGLDRTFISFLERGLRQPTLKTLFSLATVLSVRPSELVVEIEAEANAGELVPPASLPLRPQD